MLGKSMDIVNQVLRNCGGITQVETNIYQQEPEDDDYEDEYEVNSEPEEEEKVTEQERKNIINGIQSTRYEKKKG